MADNGGGDAEAEAEVAQVVDLLNAAQLATGAEERKTALATLMEAMTIPSPHIEAILEACLPVRPIRRHFAAFLGFFFFFFFFFLPVLSPSVGLFTCSPTTLHW